MKEIEKLSVNFKVDSISIALGVRDRDRGVPGAFTSNLRAVWVVLGLRVCRVLSSSLEIEV